MAIPVQFAYAANFYDGLAAVKTSDGKWGYIYPSGEYAIRPQFSLRIYFSEGLAVTTTGYGRKLSRRKMGFINKSGSGLFTPVLDGVETVFHDGVAKVIYNGVKGYINRRGSWVDIINDNDILKGNVFTLSKMVTGLQNK